MGNSPSSDWIEPGFKTLIRDILDIRVKIDEKVVFVALAKADITSWRAFYTSHPDEIEPLRDQIGNTFCNKLKVFLHYINHRRRNKEQGWRDSTSYNCKAFDDFRFEYNDRYYNFSSNGNSKFHSSLMKMTDVKVLKRKRENPFIADGPVRKKRKSEGLLRVPPPGINIPERPPRFITILRGYMRFKLVTSETECHWYNYRAAKVNRRRKPEIAKLNLPRCKQVLCYMQNDLKEFKKKIVENMKYAKDDLGILIQPISDQQDAIDMFLLFNDGRVYAMQNTISRTHSFHPLKILEYKRAAKEALEEAFRKEDKDLCDNFFHHIVVVPAATESFSLQVPTQSEASLCSIQEVLEKFKQFGLEKPKNRPRTVKSAQQKLLEYAGNYVTDITWVLRSESLEI